MSTREFVFATVEAAGMVTDRHGDLLRTLILRGPVDLRLRERGSAAATHFGDSFFAAVLARREEIAHPDPDLAVQMSFTMVYDALTRRVAFGPTFAVRRAIEWDTFVHEQAVMCAAYLLGRESSSTAP